jgi:hypothetical protein
MIKLFAFLPLSGVLLISLGCGSSSTSSSSSGTTLSCVTQISSLTGPMCQFYEATGADAARAISSLKAGCVDQGGVSAKVVDSCPTDGNLGGCKRQVTVTGGADVQLHLTDFFYKASADASVFGSPASAEAVQQRCHDDGSVFVPAP